MLLASHADILRVFKIVHGDAAEENAELIYDAEGIEIVGVAYVQEFECWRVTLAELAFDYILIITASKGENE